MKKFLSLLLAMTMVMSLIVLPARAHNDPPATPEITGLTVNTPSDVKRGDDVTFTVSGTATITDGTVTSTEYSWNVGSNFRINAGAGTSTSVSARAIDDTTATTVSCTVTCTYTVTENRQPVTKTAIKVVSTNEFSIADRLLPSDISKVTFNGREYAVTGGSVNIVLLQGENLTTGTWTATAINNYTIDNSASSANKPSYAEATGLTVNTTDATPLSTTITVTHTGATVSATATPNTVLSEGNTTLTATSNLSSEATYRWFTKSGATETPITNGTGKSFSWKVPKVDSDTPYQVICKAYEKGQTEASATSSEIPVTVKKNDFTLSVSTNPAATYNTITLSTIGTPATISSTLKGSDNKEVPSGVTYGYDVSGNTTAIVPSNANTRMMTATLRSSGTISVTPYATYLGKKITATPITISGSLLEATLSAVQNGATVNYSYSDLVTAAQTAINKNYYSSAYNYETVYTLSGVTPVANTTVYGVGTSNATYTYPTGSGYLSFTAGLTNIGTAKFTANVSTRTTAGSPKSYSITFNVPVKPFTTTYADQYPEPVASYGNTYRYYVQVPADAKYYYVAGVNNEPSDWSNGSSNKYYTTTSSTSLYSLTDTSFTNGKCTLYVVTQGTDNKLYCGTISVYQKNYNINYNGVAGETVQFKHTDFTNFMNEVSQARGDSSKTSSYPYVTFSYVTFDYPSTAQGTLYYGGTAMSTSNSSGAFNRNTKVPNLDSVTFVPNAKTTAKTITLNFTLYATRYSSSSTSHGTTVPYSGTVVVNLVREDIKYTVSQGDSVRFDESDFLSYLRSTKGYTSNYTIDYVTFDQSAVSAVNEGSLYTYYNGYNYGGSVKTTDRFYYNATASQNALSDVAFLASRYAKTGETVYIPFTIYARYGTTGTGTRQLTGTVAIKIGQTMNFIDVKTTDYFYNSVKWAVGKNITNGTSSTTFSPYKSCTRAEIVTFLWRAAGSPEPTITRNPFRDVNAVTHSSYYKAILWASQKGITSGTSATAFSPDQVCTRAQIVTFLYRYAGQPSGYYSNPFKDVGATSEASYYNAILWAVGKGITTGTSATTFSPYASCNRAEAVTFLYRYTNGL